MRIRQETILRRIGRLTTALQDHVSAIHEYTYHMARETSCDARLIPYIVLLIGHLQPAGSSPRGGATCNGSSSNPNTRVHARSEARRLVAARLKTSLVILNGWVPTYVSSRSCTLNSVATQRTRTNVTPFLIRSSSSHKLRTRLPHASPSLTLL